MCVGRLIDLTSRRSMPRHYQQPGRHQRLESGSPNPIPSSFYGYYVQGAYDVWQHGEYRVSPFARWRSTTWERVMREHPVL